MQQLRQAVLKHVRIPLQQTSTNPAAAALSSFWRGFAGGGYLDKDEVTERVLHVTKHFEKIDPAKVRGHAGSRSASTGAGDAPRCRLCRCFAALGDASCARRHCMGHCCTATGVWLPCVAAWQRVRSSRKAGAAGGAAARARLSLAAPVRAGAAGACARPSQATASPHLAAT
jgi:hypothetical protein